MSIEYASVVAAPRDEVFAWHTRPGAFRRLSPPWQPLRLIHEVDSVADGTALLGLPGGLRWVARHDGAEYDPPARFVDELSHDGARSLPVWATMSWRHVHDFEEAGPAATRVVDRVTTPVPGRLLRSTFAYRHRQLAEDLAMHRSMDAGPATVAITGASGFIGAGLAALLSTGGHRVIRLVRHATTAPDERTWNPADPSPHLFDGVDLVVHLAGASIAGRFTASHRKAIRDSRIEPTRKLAALAANGPRAFVCASAIGYYGADRGDAELDEDARRGDGLLADIVADWEAAATTATRVVTVRTGIVQSPAGGALRLQRPLFAAGLGGRLGDGSQWLSWIDYDDLLAVYHRALFDDTLSGAINAVAPNPVDNAEYTATLARVLHRPAVLPVPALGPRLLLGAEGVREVALASQRVLPSKLLAAGHEFRRPDLSDSLRHQLGKV